MPKHYYIRNEIVSFEEDYTHEFKGHRNICFEELPYWTQDYKTEKPSRRAVSRIINAFLNTGHGGTVYLGVIDNGTVAGLRLSQYQKDHVSGSIDDLMPRFNPPVKRHRYSVKFVPVFESQQESENELLQSHVDTDLQSRLHELRSYRLCWCDKDAIMQYNTACNYEFQGIMHQDYVIEIEVKAWNPDDPLNAYDGCGSIINLHPIHENEEGHCYFRRQASIVQYSMTEIAQLTRQEVQEFCRQKCSNLKKEIAALQERLNSPESV